MQLTLIDVKQGNGNGLSIERESDSVLRTTDMVACIAICIPTDNHLHMIHSDTNSTGGVGSTSLADGLKALGLDLQGSYEIALFGGISKRGLQSKFEHIKTIMPNVSLAHTHDNCDAAYLTSSGEMADTRKALSEKLDVAYEDLEFLSPPLIGMNR